ncbi:MAG: winged helix-turn-helix domain-containing protein [Pyrinomonadaceae bacterium]
MMNGEPEQIISFAEFELDSARRRLLREGKTLPLNAKAFDLLVYLAENAGRVVTKDEILDAVWANQYVEEANLKVQMSALRKVLGERKDEHRFLVTIPGKGYKFVADIQNRDRELVIESHRFSRLVVEQEIEEEETKSKEEEEKISTLPNVNASSSFRATALKLTVIGSFIVLLALAFGAYQYFNLRKANIPFEKIKLAQLTNSGKVSGAAVSPDGKYIAYILGESEGNSLWMQQVGTASSVRLLPPVKAQVYELTFTPDGSHIFYNLFADGNADPEFYRISSLGGINQRIPNVIASYIAFAPDGKRFAYAQSDSAARQNHLVIADADGTNQQTILSKKHPNTFETQVPVVAWSPDGETIACLVNHFEADASYSSIVGVNARDGSEKLLSGQRWYNVFSIEWLKNGSGLLISANDKISGGNQVRFLSYPQGEARQITNDLSQYDSLSATADGESFVAIQTNTVNDIFVGETNADANDYKEIISETGALYPFVWTPDGKIIYRSHKDGVSNLWTMDADGGNRRQLTTNAQVDSRGLCISPDGKHLVFGSWRSGKSNLWRVDADGENLTQLTNGEADVYPSCSPDNRTIVYQKGLHSNQRLWKVALAGGESFQLTDSYSKWSAISNDGSRISYFFMADDKWRFGIISSEGGSMLQRLDIPVTLKENVVRWSADNQSLFYISTVGSVGNIWSLPLNGSETKPVTNFKSHSIDSFAFSPDKKRLAIARRLTLSNVVLVTNENLP